MSLIPRDLSPFGRHILTLFARDIQITVCVLKKDFGSVRSPFYIRQVRRPEHESVRVRQHHHAIGSTALSNQYPPKRAVRARSAEVRALLQIVALNRHVGDEVLIVDPRERYDLDDLLGHPVGQQMEPVQIIDARRKLYKISASRQSASLHSSRNLTAS
jgi:hypothetical protein